MKYLRIIIVFIFLMPNILFAEKVNLYTDDVALIHHIKQTDYVFTTALGECVSEKLKRGEKSFEFTAVCEAMARKGAEGGGCPEYLVIAKGTVDNDHWATVREMKLELKCYN